MTNPKPAVDSPAWQREERLYVINWLRGVLASDIPVDERCIAEEMLKTYEVENEERD